MMRSTGKGGAGFTLVEILFVMAIFGIVVGAVYSLYLTHQKTAYVQEDLVDLQQSLRIAMDSITRDLRMAGMLVPLATNPLANGPLNNYSTSVQINTASATGQFARVARSKTTAAFSIFSTSVDAPESVDGLVGAGDTVYVRLIRPTNRSNPVSPDNYLVLDASSNRSGPTVALKKPDGGTFSAGIGIDSGDIIALAGQVPPVAAPPAGCDSIVYSLAPCTDAPSLKCLNRAVNGTQDEISSNISWIRFSYLYDDGNENNNPADPINPHDPATIRSVRVTIAGETAATSALSGGPKRRQITSVIKLRNKR